MPDVRQDIPHRHVTWADVHRDTKELVRRLLGAGPGGGPWTGIVALTRGGLVPAAIMAREMGLRVVDTLCITSYDEQTQGSIRVLKTPEGAMASAGEGWLMIDDLVDTGATAAEARRLLPEAHFATVYAKPQGRPHVDTYVHDVAQEVWVFFPWATEPRYVAPLGSPTD